MACLQAFAIWQFGQKAHRSAQLLADKLAAWAEKLFRDAPLALSFAFCPFA
jgi:hypothetical protein